MRGIVATERHIGGDHDGTRGRSRCQRRSTASKLRPAGTETTLRSSPANSLSRDPPTRGRRGFRMPDTSAASALWQSPLGSAVRWPPPLPWLGPMNPRRPIPQVRPSRTTSRLLRTRHRHPDRLPGQTTPRFLRTAPPRNREAVLARRTHQSRCPRRSRPPDRASSSVARAARIRRVATMPPRAPTATRPRTKVKAQRRRQNSSPPGVKNVR